MSDRQPNIFFEKLFAPIIAGILTPITTAIGSKISNNDWLLWFKKIPVYVWIVIGIIFIIWFIIVLIIRRKKRLNELNGGSGITSITSPFYGWRKIGELDYKGVTWIAQVPAPHRYSLVDDSKFSADDVEIDIPPRCPKCKTEIEEKHLFWGGCIWSCVNCDFRKKNKYSYYTERHKAEKIAKRKVEKSNEK